MSQENNQQMVEAVPNRTDKPKNASPPELFLRSGSRILYIVPPSPTFAGVERVIHDIANAIMSSKSSNFQVSVLYFVDYETLQHEPIRYELIHRPAGRLRHIPAVLRQLLREREFDLIIVPQVEAATFAWASIPPRLTRMAVYLHGNPWVERSRSWQSGALFIIFRLLAARRFHGVLAVAPSLARKFQAEHPSLKESRWVPNPVRPFRERQVGRAVRKGPVTFLNIGRLSFQKGQDLLLSAFAQVHAARPATRLQIVGQGEMKLELEARIAKLALTGVVRILNMPSNPGPAFVEADIFVSASRWEGWSLVIVEALSFGLPVVATNCNFGPRDILIDSRLGRLVPNGSITALAEAMIAAYDETDDAAHDAPFRQSYAAQYQVENVVDAHIEAINVMVM